MPRRSSTLIVTTASVLLTGLLATPAAWADGGGSAPPPPSPTPSTFPSAQPMSPEEKAAVDAKRAEDLYRSAWEDAQKADAEMKEADALLASADPKQAEKAKKKTESAVKRYGKAADRFKEVTQLTPKNANAWNMLGYSYRKSGKLQPAFEAYWECLRLDPEHAGGHEYLGEAYLMSGKLEQAKNELAWLQKREAKEAATLEQSIARYLSDHPEVAKAEAEKAQAVVPPNPFTSTTSGPAPVKADSTR